MAAPAVSFDGTRVHVADSTGTSGGGTWSDIGGGKASTEPDFIYQGSGSVSEKVGTSEGGVALDMVASRNFTTGKDVWLAKHIATNSSVLNNEGSTGGILEIGSGGRRSAYYRYYVVGGDTYPLKGGWLITPIDPSVAIYRDATTGTPILTGIDYYGWACDFSATSKAENVAMDAIDVVPTGQGLTISRGDGVSPDATFADFAAKDEDAAAANRWGVVTTNEGIIFACGGLRIGPTNNVATDFTDSLAVIVWPGGRVDAGHNRLLLSLGSNCTISISNCSFIGRGVVSSATSRDTRFSIESTFAVVDGGTADFTGCGLSNYRRVKLYDADVTMTDCTFNSGGQIDPTNSDYSGGLDMDGTTNSSCYLTTGNLFDTNPSGDWEVIAHLRLDSLTATQNICGNDIPTGSDWSTQVNSSAVPQLLAGDGTTFTTFTATASPFSAQVDTAWLQFRYDHSAGQAFFYYSYDHVDTPWEDVVWTANGSPTGTARSNSSPSSWQTYIGDAFTTGKELNGEVHFVSAWSDGWSDPGGGDQEFMADFRVGPDFVSGTREKADALVAGMTWQKSLTGTTYAQGDDNTAAADLDGSVVSNPTAASALRWNVNSDPNGELDNMTFNSGGTGHAIEFGKNTPSTITLTNQTYTGYAGTDGSTGNETIFNNSGKAITINSDVTCSIRNGTGASTTLVVAPVTTLVNVKDNNGDNLSGARVLLEASDGTGDFPYQETPTSITSSGTLATCTLTAHGLKTNDIAVIRGADQNEYNGPFSVTVTGANTFTYTMSGDPVDTATGTITVTGGILSGTTDASGNISASRTMTLATPVTGFVRKSSASPRFKAFALAGTISTTIGLTINVRMVLDE